MRKRGPERERERERERKGERAIESFRIPQAEEEAQTTVLRTHSQNHFKIK